MIKIEDYELMNNWDMICEYPVIIYGAGNMGFEILALLTDAGNITVEAFCDGNVNKKTYCGRKVIHIEEMVEYVADKDYNVIIASIADYKQMIQEMETRNVKAKHVYTWWGVEAALVINSHHPMVDVEFGISYKESIKKECECKRKKSILLGAQNAVLKKPEVLVFQYGKVASSSIYCALLEKGCNCRHIHYLCGGENDKQIQKWQERYKEEVHNNGVKIITLVREPIVRYISWIMQEFMRWIVNNDSKSITETMQDDVIENAKSCHTWFYHQIEQLTGVDIFDYPFDKEKGYTVIQKNGVEILLMTLEKLKFNEAVIADFVGIKDFKLVSANVTNDKITNYVYEALKKDFKVSEEMLDKVYKVFQMEHFYSDEDIEEYKNKWLSSIE